MELKYSSEMYQNFDERGGYNENVPMEAPKIIKKTVLGKKTVLSQKERVNYTPNKNINLENNINGEEIIIKSDILNTNKYHKETKAEFLIKTILKAFYLSIWKKKVKSMKYMARGYNAQRSNFKKLIRQISMAIKQHKYEYFNEIIENMSSLPMPKGVKHKSCYGSIRIVNKEVLKKKYPNKMTSCEEGIYNKKVDGLKVNTDKYNELQYNKENIDNNIINNNEQYLELNYQNNLQPEIQEGYYMNEYDGFNNGEQSNNNIEYIYNNKGNYPIDADNYIKNNNYFGDENYVEGNNYTEGNNYVENNNYINNNHYVEKSDKYLEGENYVIEDNNNLHTNSEYAVEVDNNYNYNDNNNFSIEQKNNIINEKIDLKENDYNNNDYRDTGFSGLFDNNDEKEYDYNNNDFVENEEEDTYNEVGNKEQGDNNYILDNYGENNYSEYYADDYLNNNEYGKNEYIMEDVNEYPNIKYGYNYEYTDNYNNYSDEKYDNDYFDQNEYIGQMDEGLYYNEPKQQIGRNEYIYYLPSSQKQNEVRYVSNQGNTLFVNDVYSNPNATNNSNSEISVLNYNNLGNNKYVYYENQQYKINNNNVSGTYMNYKRAFPSRYDNHTFYVSK